ncbi:amino acid/amide ABC transporter substrate-binding protein (HAAT family) [Sinobacterium caligoides]|uniref:Amino acid/amide ABC transporter substrate-binding protein (HAAT family) n=1 Tax=Sinobacterium caligoides TaxID=933926 RepID=A0A3N2E0G0_9GAMM|nr:ABC transporter substrate-binding protein [Sinobacterium caligoides]ROS05568.1 amino acid/amide ABC transporter substrate-binding protein (HAAT family) [Sinobacterium caligoides]
MIIRDEFLLLFKSFKLTVALIFLVFCCPVSAVSNDKGAAYIELGMTTSISGPSRDLGDSVLAGVNAYIRHVNKNGGINNKQIRLTVLDDGYQPEAAIINARKLVEEHNVIAMIGNVGTPTAKVTEPYANKEGVIFFSPYTGADILRDVNKSPYTFNYRASYEQELSLIINHIFEKGIEVKDIVFFIQDDSYGLSGLNAARSVFKKLGFADDQKLNILRYKRNTNNVNSALNDLLRLSHTPKAIILIAAYGASANFINYSSSQFPMLSYFNISFVGSHALENHLNISSKNIYITQVVPPMEFDLPIISRFKSHLSKFGDDNMINSTSLEGYIAANILVSALKKIKGKITSEKLKTTLENMGEFDIGIGDSMVLNEMNHQASQKVWLLQYDNNKSFSPMNTGENL